MKRLTTLLLFSAVTLLVLQCCRNNTAARFFSSGDEYKGTAYTLKKPARFPKTISSYTDSLTTEGVELGRRLFYDKHLSASGTKSCASCHLQQFAFSDSGLALSANESGLTKRNAPALQNLAWSKDFFWDGKLNRLDAQAQDAAHNELNMATDVTLTYLRADSTYTTLFKKAFGNTNAINEPNIHIALRQFLLTLVSANSKYDRVKGGEAKFTEAEARGFNVFSTDTGGCFRCHNSDGGYTLLLADNQFHNNGLDVATTPYAFADSGRGGITHAIADYGKFKTPSLRNIALTGPYMHDGRYKTLEQVVNFYSDSTRLSPSLDPIIIYVFKGTMPHHLTQQQKNDLVVFLHTLTDSGFISNPAFADPFK